MAAALGVVLHRVYRRRGRAAAVVDFVTTVPVGLPGIVLRRAVLLGFLRTSL